MEEAEEDMEVEEEVEEAVAMEEVEAVAMEEVVEDMEEEAAAVINQTIFVTFHLMHLCFEAKFKVFKPTAFCAFGFFSIFSNSVSQRCVWILIPVYSFST